MLPEKNSDNLTASKNNLLLSSEPYISAAGKTWLEEAMQAIVSSKQSSEDLGLFSAMAKRKCGAVYMEKNKALETVEPPLNLQHWTTADACRIILLICSIERCSEQSETIINAYFKMGDEAEHIALVRSLMLFAPAEYLTKIALDAGRTNSLEILSALMLDNPYPATFYSESEFNQMVLKGLFLGLAIERVSGITQRANPELSRMGENYVVERENANRTVPVDIWLAIGPCASDTGKQQILTYLTHDEAGHRYYCTLALIQRLPQDASLLPILKQRLAAEQEPIISKLLQENLPV